MGSFNLGVISKCIVKGARFEVCVRLCKDDQADNVHLKESLLTNFDLPKADLGEGLGKVGYNINALRQTTCLVVSPITVDNFAFLFICMLAGQTSDSMTVPS